MAFQTRPRHVTGRTCVSHGGARWERSGTQAIAPGIFIYWNENYYLSWLASIHNGIIGASWTVYIVSAGLAYPVRMHFTYRIASKRKVRRCAAQQGMVFASLSLKQGLQIGVSVWNRVYFLPFRLRNTAGVTFLLLLLESRLMIKRFFSRI